MNCILSHDYCIPWKHILRPSKPKKYSLTHHLTFSFYYSYFTVYGSIISLTVQIWDNYTMCLCYIFHITPTYHLTKLNKLLKYKLFYRESITLQRGMARSDISICITGSLNKVIRGLSRFDLHNYFAKGAIYMRTCLFPSKV